MALAWLRLFSTFFSLLSSLNFSYTSLPLPLSLKIIGAEAVNNFLLDLESDKNDIGTVARTNFKNGNRSRSRSKMQICFGFNAGSRSRVWKLILCDLAYLSKKLTRPSRQRILRSSQFSYGLVHTGMDCNISQRSEDGIQSLYFWQLSSHFTL